jgi:TatD DNase family protein
LYINIHSHNPPINNSHFVIQNLYNNFETVEEKGFYSIGIHPWYVDEENWQKQISTLQAHGLHKSVLALGECGLDKLCNTAFSLQEKVFVAQILWANKIKKPLIIHCVKAYAEVQQLLKECKNKVSVIFHGYNKNEMLAKELIGKGYYLSFGKALQNVSSQDVLSTLPMEQLFLETDDGDISIEAVYSLAAAGLKIDLNTLILQITNNAKVVFGTSISI